MPAITTHYIDNIQQKIISQILDYKLIEENDKVLLAVSGGKDSLILLEALTQRRRKIPYAFHLIVAHITDRNKTYETNTDYLEEYCKNYHVTFIQREISIEKQEGDKDRSYCFLCSWHRRKAIFDLTREFKINKLVFAHNMDDAIETLLMNMIYHGSISSLPFKVSMFDGRIQLVRPMLAIGEKDLEKYAEVRQFPAELKRCTHADNTKRTDMRNLIDMLEKMNPRVRKNLFRSMSKQCPEYLPQIIRK